MTSNNNVVIQKPIEINPDLREWEYDGHGVKRYKDTFKVYEEKDDEPNE